MTIESQHPEYEKHVKEWNKVTDCIAGQRAVKEKSTDYLPLMEGAQKGDVRYGNYIDRAVFVNYTGRTKDGLLGAIFRKPAEVEVPDALEYIIDNADGAGESLESLSKDVATEVIGKGRHFLLVDFPEVTKGMTLEEQQLLQPQASINRYTCEQAINWRAAVKNGRKMLDLVVLQEVYDANDDEFEYEEAIQHRVLRLRDGVYTQQVYRDGHPHTEEVTPRKANGQPFSEIPCIFIGSENNDATVDYSPLADIAHVNLAHYRNSADLEENCFVHGQMTLGISTSMSHSQFEEANPSGITVGAMSGHFLGEGGSFSSVQAAENQLADKLMERKEEQMRKLGARMVEATGAKTATQSRIDATGESSILSTIAGNVSSGINTCLGWAAEFMGTDQETSYTLNTKFFDDDVNPQMLMAAIQLNDRGIIAKSDMQDLARAQSIIKPERTNDDIDEEVEVSDPATDFPEPAVIEKEAEK